MCPVGVLFIGTIIKVFRKFSTAYPSNIHRLRNTLNVGLPQLNRLLKSTNKILKIYRLHVK